MHESVLELARLMTAAGTAEEKSLEALCAAAEAEWSRRLRPGVTPEQCGSAYLCAAAFSAAAGLALVRAGGGHVSFRAGDVSVTQGAGSADGAARALREQAERLMAPFVGLDDFVFRGVRA